LRNRALNWAVDRALFADVEAHFRATRAEFGLDPAAGKAFLDSICGPYLFLQSSVPSFDYPRSDLPRQLHFVGPFLPRPARDFAPPNWWHELRGPRPIVHVTQGTSATDPRELIVPTLRGLADENVLIVASTGGRAVSGDELGRLPSNSRVESFIPHANLLPHVSIMITNAGYGGVQIALAHGIPLIAAGGSEEKPEVARRIAWSGTGLDLRTKTPSPNQVRDAVRTLLRDPRYRERAQRLRAEIAHYDAATRSVELLEQLAHTGKPVLTPPAIAPAPIEPRQSSELSVI
jgi:UDP:flavonoid glycosyltransferase YjiC (YdhE family)